jgi:carboxyl-terminal processing protease
MENDRRPSRDRGAAVWLLPLIAGLLLGALLHNYILPDPYPSSAVPRDAAQDFKLMAEAWNAVERHYVDRPAVRPRTMTYGAITGMVDSLGDTGHSGFLSPEMVKAAAMIESGQYTGIGVEIQMKDKQVVVVAPLDGSPARKAGVRAGDIITAVNGESIAGLAVQEVVRRIKGTVDTRLNLTLEDPATGAQRTVTVTREKIRLRSVTWSLLPGTRIAHLRISVFSKGTLPTLDKALADIDRAGARGLVLDLRNDPGGILDVAVGVASRFLQNGDVLQEKDAEGRIKPVPVENGTVKSSLPMAVLINAGSASASEIVAGALQDAGRAKIIGETTFGTGTVLEQVPLSDGSALLLAVREWLTPRGRTIWHKGITPDVAVKLPPGVPPLAPEAEQGMSAEHFRASKDRQLLRAVEIIGSGRDPAG